MRRVIIAGAFAIVLAGALALRIPDLANRPMHGDEAVHTFRFRDLWQTGVFRYDPDEYHGPTLYYATLPVVWAEGRPSFAATRETDYRLVTALFGAALVLLFLLMRDGVGTPAALLAALFCALSPAFVFYSRYYIQEVLLAFFTLGALALGWRYVRSGRPGWLVGSGVCAGLMLASKETAVVSFGAAAVAFWVAARGRRGPEGGPMWRWRHFVVAGLVAAVVAALFLSGFLTHPRGMVDIARSYVPWLNRAGGQTLHRHEWAYYLSMLTWTHRGRGPVWTEGLIVGLSLVGLIAAFFAPGLLPRGASPRLARFLAVFTLLLTAGYSVIPYKTPWCVLSFLLGMAMLAGLGAVGLVQASRPLVLRLAAGALILACVAGIALSRAQALGPLPSPAAATRASDNPVLLVALVAAVAVLGLVATYRPVLVRLALGIALAGGLVHLGWLSYQTSFVHPTAGINPYAYAQPVPDVVDFGKRITDLAMSTPQKAATVVKVISSDNYYWPLPWYIRSLTNVGYWNSVPADAQAPVVIASPGFDEELTKRLDKTHVMTGYYGLRPTVAYMVWVRMDVWEAYLKAHPPVVD